MGMESDTFEKPPKIWLKGCDALIRCFNPFIHLEEYCESVKNISAFSRISEFQSEGLCASCLTMETLANSNCTLFKFQKYCFYYLKNSCAIAATELSVFNFELSAVFFSFLEWVFLKNLFTFDFVFVNHLAFFLFDTVKYFELHLM